MCRWRFDGLWILEHLSIFLILSIFKMDEKDLKPIGHGKRWGYTSMGICEVITLQKIRYKGKFLYKFFD